MVGDNKNTFVIKVLSKQNHTWQGTVYWLETKRNQPFRSLLELIKLLDSTLGSDDDDE